MQSFDDHLQAVCSSNMQVKKFQVHADGADAGELFATDPDGGGMVGS